MELIIKLTIPRDPDPEIGWKPALKAAALEIQGLNAAQLVVLQGKPYDPIPSNPNADQIENYLGLANTPPNDDGRTMVAINRDYLQLEDLPAMPKTFSFVLGAAPCGTISK